MSLPKSALAALRRMRTKSQAALATVDVLLCLSVLAVLVTILAQQFVDPGASAAGDPGLVGWGGPTQDGR